MATRLKTVEYWFPMNTAGFNDAVDTNLTQITVYLPENGKTFRNVVAEAVVHDLNTSVSNINRHQISLRIGASAYTVVNNTNFSSLGGEQQTILFSGDFTGLFTASWTGTSMTADCRLLLDSAAASPLVPSWRNASVRLIVTYEYDDTTTTHVKTVCIPLDLPTGAMGTVKPASLATIPALDTELPEASKVYRQQVLVLQGNDNNSGTTDMLFNMQIDTDAAFASGNYEHASTVSMFVRCNAIQTFTTNATHSFYAWASVAMGHHMQAWLVVTYEFDSTAANDVYVSLMLPIEMDSPMGGPTSADYQRAVRELVIPETGMVQKQVAAYVFWDSQGVIGGLNWRIGTGSFVTYTDSAAVLAGSNTAMIRNDAAFTLARGRNTLSVDCYRSDTVDLGFNVCGFFIVNYTCDKPSGGHGAVNHSVFWSLSTTGTVSHSVDFIIAATAIDLPEADFYMTSVGTEFRFFPSGTVAPVGSAVQVERLAGEGGIIWEALYANLSGTDGEIGIYHSYSQARDVFMRWPADQDPNRIDLSTSRRWRWVLGNSASGRGQLRAWITYHSIPFTVAGSVSGSGGGTVTLDLYRASATKLSEKVKTTSRSGDGSYSFTWYVHDDDLFVVAREDATHLGRSDTGVPA